MTAWARSSATSGRSTSMSSYRRMRQDTPSNGNRPADGRNRRGTERKQAEDSTGSVRLRPRGDANPVRPRRPRERPMYSLAHSAGRKIRRRSTSKTARGGTVPASTILLIDADPAAAESIASALTRVGYAVTTSADPADALQKVADHQLVIVDVITGASTAVDVCREIRATPTVSSIPVMCVARTDDVEERINFLEAGADDVMARPFDGRELEARVEALLLRFQRSRDLSAVVSTDGVTVTRVRRVVAVHSPKGGAGTSTVATNIATVAG